MNKHLLNKIATAMLPLGIGMASVQSVGAYTGRSSYLPNGRNSVNQSFSHAPLNPPRISLDNRSLSHTSLKSKQQRELAEDLILKSPTPAFTERQVTTITSDLEFELKQLNPVKELVVIDAAIVDKQAFYKKNKPGVKIVEVQFNQNGLTQLTDLLKNYHNLDALHLVTHADDGVIYLGDTAITEQILKHEINTLSALDSALKDGGDLLFYGCNLARGKAGESLLELIAHQANVDVAASNNLTGNAQLKGDWELEITTGSIETEQPFSMAALRDFSEILVASDGIKNFSGWSGNGTYTLSTTDFNLTGTDNSGSETLTIYGGSVYMTDPGAATGAAFFLQADGTNTGSFELTALQFKEYAIDRNTSNVFVRGYVAGGGTVTSSTLSGTGARDTFSFGAGQLGSFSGQQLTGFKVFFDTNQVDYSQIDSFTIVNAASPNTAPTLSNAPASITVTEDAASDVNLSAVTLADVDGDSLTFTLTANAGTLAASSGGSVTVGGSGTGTMTLAGTAANINTYLDTTSNIQYTTSANDTTARNIALKANDGTVDSATSNVTVNITDIADIISDSVPANGTYGNAANLDFTLTFDESVTVSGTPRIALNIGGATKYATFSTGNATATSGTILTFRYAVEAGLLDLDGIGVTNAVDLNSGSIVDTDLDGSGADLSNVSFASTAGVLVNSADSDGNLTSAAGVSEPVNLAWSVDTVGEAVNLFDFTLTDGGSADGLAMTASNIVVNVSGTASDADRAKVTWRLNGNDAVNVVGTYNAGSNTITFAALSISIADGASEIYTVNGYYNDNTGLTSGNTIILSLDGDTDVTIGASGTQMGATSAINNGSGTVITDDISPVVTSVNVPANSTYGASANLDFTVNFDENVTVNTGGGTPRLSLTIGATGRFADYIAGSGTSALVFREVVVAGDQDLDGISLGATVDPNSGTLRDSSGNNINTTLNSVGSLASVLVDALAPTVAEVTPVSTPGNDTTPDVTFSTSEAGTLAVGGSCGSADEGAVSSGNSTITLTQPDNSTPLAAGTYNDCTVTVTDSAGNVSNVPTLSSFVVDLTAPAVAEVTPVVTPGNDTTPDVTFSTDEAGTLAIGGSCGSADEGAIASGNSTITLTQTDNSTPLAAGTYADCTVTVTDSAGNANTPVTLTSFTLDLSGPTLAEVTPVITPANDTTPDVTFSTNEAGTLAVGGSCGSASEGAIGSGNNTITLTQTDNSTPLAAGTYADCTVTVTDGVGNASSALTLTSFTIDLSAPTVAEVTPVVTPGNDTTPNVTFSTNEAGTLAVGGSCGSASEGAIGAGNNTIALTQTDNATPLAAGSYSDCTITVTDGSGNANTPVTLSSFTIDLSAPTVAEITPVVTPTNDSTPDVTFSTNEAGTLAIGGSCGSTSEGAIGSGNNTITLTQTDNSTPLAAGTYADCTVTVTDSSGNANTPVTLTSFTLDLSGPTLAEVTPVVTPANDTTPDVTFSTNEAGTLAVGGSCGSASEGAIGSGNNTITLTQTDNSTPLAAGTYADCSVTVTDGVGNASSALTLSSFTIDLSGPTVAEVTPVVTPGNDTTPNVTFSTDEAGTLAVGGSCGSASEGAIGAGNNTIALTQTDNATPLAGGSYSDCTITVTDGSGNANTPVTLSSFTIDLSAPTVAEVTPVVTPTNDSTPDVTFSTNEAGTLAIGGSCGSASEGAIGSGNNTITLTQTDNSTPLAAGTYADCTVTITDSSGNANTPLTLTSFTLDLSGPTLAEVTPVVTPANDTTPDVTFSTNEAGTLAVGGSCGSASEGAIGSGNNTITLTQIDNSTPLAAGSYADCTVTVTDGVGNASSALTLSSFTIDLSAPTVAEVTPVVTPGNDATPNVTFSTNEAGTLAVGGSCGSASEGAIGAGNNTIALTQTDNATPLAAGSYSDCTITVTDGSGNANTPVTLSSFTIDVTAPTVAEVTPVVTPDNDSTPDVTFSTSEAGTLAIGGSCGSASEGAIGSGNNTITLTQTDNSTPLVGATYADCTVTVTDSAGNASSALTLSSFVIDLTSPTVAEVTPVATPGNDSTPDVTFSTDEAGSLLVGGSCGSANEGAIGSGNNTITLTQADNSTPLVGGTYSDCTVTVTDDVGNVSNVQTLSSFVVDLTAPTIVEVTPVVTPGNDTTPDVTFSIDEAGTLSVGGSCGSASEGAIGAGNNTITLTQSDNSTPLTSGTYSDCTVSVADGGGNDSNVLTLSSFVVDITSAVVNTNTGKSLNEDDTGIIVSNAELSSSDNVSNAANITYTLVSITSNGTLRNNGGALAVSGTFTQADIDNSLLTYDHNGSETLSDTFTFTVTDELGNINDNSGANFSFNFTIAAVNDIPVATEQSVNVVENIPVAIVLSGTDIETTTLNYTVVDQPANGTLTGVAPNMNYAPNADYVGADSFTFIANDGTDDSLPSTISLTVLGDLDGDGDPDVTDEDDDGDGIPDSVEGSGDADGDGIPNDRDLDSDGDGISDADEGVTDSDGDGTPDFLDSSIDEDNDGIPDIVEGTIDSDNDGFLNFQDADSDNDGLTDTTESEVIGVDTDGDGIDDAFDVDQTGGTDANGDGIDDDVAAKDSDGDGIADRHDIDSDNDGIPDVIEAFLRSKDTDSDGIEDSVDVDQTGGVDADGDSIDDSFDVTYTEGIDADLDGIDDALLPLSDRDNDGIADYLDLDSDNDGISDTAEAGMTGIDTDNDGIDDSYDIDSTFGIDINNDGIDDDATVLDTDSDGVPDLHDLDSDNDGLFDTLEANVLDANSNALADTSVTLVETPVDDDADSTANFRDLDSDDDGANDIDSTPYSNLDADDDGRIDITTDTDGDGIDDSVDTLPLEHGVAAVDRDLDGDGIANVTEGTGDFDMDGVNNLLDRDSDNDGLSDAFETDRPLPLGLDSDGDGIDDAYDVDVTGGVDANLDGVDDQFVEVDTDADGQPDYLDSDSDNDGISDTVEQVLVSLTGTDSDNDGIDDAVDVDLTQGTDLNSDGIDDAMLNQDDFDGDGLPNFRDLDSDGDGILDSVEGSSDADGDGAPNYLDLDSDGDGIPDSEEGTVDSDGDGIADYLDTDSDGDGILDRNENGDFNNDGINDRLQANGKVVTGSGSGSNGLVFLALIGALVIISRRKKAAPILLALTSLFSLNSQADDSCEEISEAFSDSQCWYLGGGVGQSSLKPDTNTTSWRLSEDSDTAFQIFAGLTFKQHFFAELNYQDMGTAELINLNPAITEQVNIDYSAFSLNVGYWLNEKPSEWNFYAKAGVSSLSTSTSSQVEQDRSAQLTFGAGVQWHFSEDWFTRMEMTSYSEDAKVMGFTIAKYF